MSGGQDIYFADGFEDAFLGLVTQFVHVIACYDYNKCLEILEQRDGLPRLDAEEYMETNVVGAWVGPSTPVFLRRWNKCNTVEGAKAFIAEMDG